MNFGLENHVRISSKLNDSIWEPCCDDIKCMYPKHYCLKKEIRQRLLKIAYDFHVYLGIDIPIEDIILTGSLANFNYTQYSDIDIHILIDYRKINEDYLFVNDYLSAKKVIWNDKHEIMIKGYEVEMYAQDVSEAHHSTGVFSILRNEWIKSPNLQLPKIDFHSVMEKSRCMMDYIDHVLLSPERETNIDRLKQKIKNMRKSGLESSGEFSVENLTFKVLRNTGYLKKIYDVARSDYDSRLSIKQ